MQTSPPIADENERGPPGMASLDDVNDDQDGRDTALYYRDDGGGTQGPFAKDVIERWIHQGHFQRAAVFYLNVGLDQVAGTAEELFPSSFESTLSVGGAKRKSKRKKSKKHKKKKDSSSPDSSSSSSSSDEEPGGKRGRKNLKMGDDIKIKATAEPPDAATQQAIWEAASKHPRAISLAEQELQRRKPGASASADETMQFQFELMQVRQRNPTPVPFPLSGKLTRSTHQLPADVPLARGMPNWTAPLALRYFRPTDGSSLIDIDRETAKSQVVTVGDASFFTRSASSGTPPDPPKPATEFQLFVSQRSASASRDPNAEPRDLELNPEAGAQAVKRQV